ncbi:uncharacterized protein LOC142013431 isoform X2 [Carettochelys insculpta]|uniref:uncharacterized protein LOC142013431 isoform X2 n=1 Tax=Carettochelys insculpta TaxID=44489 RepID=UPI003EBEFB03
MRKKGNPIICIGENFTRRHGVSNIKYYFTCGHTLHAAPLQSISTGASVHSGNMSCQGTPLFLWRNKTKGLAMSLSSSSSSSPSPPPRRPGRPTIYSPSEKKRRRKSLERKRAQSRICIREQIGRWMSLRETLNVFSHAEVAKFLLDLYDSYENQDVTCKEAEVKIQEAGGNSTLNVEEDVPETSLTACTERLPCEDLEDASTDNSGEEYSIDNEYDLSKSFSSVKHLKNVSVAEDILGITDECDDGSQGDFMELFEETTHDITLDDTQDISREKIHIVYEHSLLQLAKKHVIPKCLFCAGEVYFYTACFFLCACDVECFVFPMPVNKSNCRSLGSKEIPL